MATRTFLLMALLLGMTTGCQPNSEVVSTPQTESSPSQTPAEISKSADGQETKPQNPSRTADSTSSIQPCEVYAYVADQDPQGLNVRSGPSSNQKVIGKLPTTNVMEVLVDISASQGDWVQITKAESEKKVEFQGKGWVYASLLGINTRGYESEGVSVYSSPSNQSKVIGRIPAKTSVKLLGCQARWVKVDYKGLKGWLTRNDQCSATLTTCS